MNKKIIKPKDFIIGYIRNDYYPYIYGNVERNERGELLVNGINERGKEEQRMKYIGDGTITDLIDFDVDWFIFPSEKEKTEFLSLPVRGKRSWIDKRRRLKKLNGWDIREVANYFSIGCGEVALTKSEMEEVKNYFQAITEIPISKRLKEIIKVSSEEENIELLTLPVWVKGMEKLLAK